MAVKKSMRAILKELKEYNDTHEHAITYGKYIQMLEQEEKIKAEQDKQKMSSRSKGGSKMGRDYHDAKIKCPYYIKQSQNRIVCEGICADNRINIWFENEQIKNDYIKNHCYNINTQCYVCRMLESVKRSKSEL